MGWGGGKDGKRGGKVTGTAAPRVAQQFGSKSKLYPDPIYRGVAQRWRGYFASWAFGALGLPVRTGKKGRRGVARSPQKSWLLESCHFHPTLRGVSKKVLSVRGIFFGLNKYSLGRGIYR